MVDGAKTHRLISLTMRHTNGFETVAARMLARRVWGSFGSFIYALRHRTGEGIGSRLPPLPASRIPPNGCGATADSHSEVTGGGYAEALCARLATG
jgi:hypothetical protein